MKEFFFITALIFCYFISVSQTSDSWAHIYFNPESPSEALNGFDIEPLSNGTFVAATRNAVMNIDSVGTPFWVVDGYYEHLAIAENDNIVLISGTVVYKMSSTGTLIWSKNLSNIGYGLCGVAVVENGYVVAGTKSNNRMYVSKFSQDGNQLWAKHVNLTGNSTARGIMATSEGELFLTGYTRAYTDNNVSEMILIKLSSSGSVIWTKTYALDTYQQEGKQIYETSDGNYLLKGASLTPDAISYHLSIMNIDSNGNVNWAQHFPGLSSSSDIYVSPNEFIIAGYSPYWPDARMIFMDYSGSIYQIIQMEDSNILAISKTEDGNFYVIGHAVEPSYGTMIGKVDENFNSCFTFESTYEGNEYIEFTVTSKNLATISDALFSEQGETPSELILESITKCNSEATSVHSVQIFNDEVPFPNPASGYVNIPISGAGHIEIFNSLGHRIMEIPISSKEYENVSIEVLSPGVYMYRIRTLDQEVKPGKNFVVACDG